MSVWLLDWLSSRRSVARLRCVQLVSTYALTPCLQHVGTSLLSSPLVSRTAEVSWLKPCFTNWCFNAASPSRPMENGGFLFGAVWKALSMHSSQKKVLFPLSCVICMLDGRLFSLWGLQNNLHNSPVAVVSQLNSPQRYKQLKTCFGSGLNTEP